MTLIEVETSLAYSSYYLFRAVACGPKCFFYRNWLIYILSVRRYQPNLIFRNLKQFTVLALV
jgi:hypothetical protein